MVAIEESQTIDQLGSTVTALKDLELFDSVLWWSIGNKFNELCPPDQIPAPEQFALISRLQMIPLLRNLCDLRIPEGTQKDREVGQKLFVDSFVYMKVP
jgi:hypothetical protein